MTKRHYKAMAQLIRESENLEQFIKLFVEFAKADNERFDRTKFLKAIK